MKEAIGHKCNAILNIFIFNMRCNVKEIESQVSKGRYDPPEAKVQSQKKIVELQQGAPMQKQSKAFTFRLEILDSGLKGYNKILGAEQDGVRPIQLLEYQMVWREGQI